MFVSTDLETIFILGDFKMEDRIRGFNFLFGWGLISAHSGIMAQDNILFLPYHPIQLQRLGLSLDLDFTMNPADYILAAANVIEHALSHEHLIRTCLALDA